MSNKVDKGKNIDVFFVDDASALTIKDYLDVKLGEDFCVRVCLCQHNKTHDLSLRLDRQLVVAFDKHESRTINSYDIVWFFDNEERGQEKKIIGDGNLIPAFFDIIGDIKQTPNAVNKVMIMVQRCLSITV